MYQPLFILCPGRSFSSVVCSMLGQHSALHGVPEVNLFLTETLGQLVDLAERKRKKHMLHGLVRVLAELEFGDQSDESGDKGWQWIEEHRDWTTTRVYHYLCDLMGPQQCVDKSPVYGAKVDYLERLYRAFPDAYFLHIARHPRATGNSLYRVYAAKAALGRIHNFSTDNAKVEEHWIKSHRNIFEFTDRLPPGQCLRLQGELLLNNPQPYLQQICEWMGIDDSEAEIEAMLHPEGSPYANFGPRSAPYGNNLGFLENPKLRIGGLKQLSLKGPLEWLEDEGEFSRETVDLAHQLGYQ